MHAADLDTEEEIQVNHGPSRRALSKMSFGRDHGDAQPAEPLHNSGKPWAKT